MDFAMCLDPTAANYGDLLVAQNGDVLATSDADARGTQCVLQNVIQRLKMLQGEWFMDTSIGVPYFQTIFQKGTSLEAVELILSNCILGTPGVLAMTALSTQYVARLRAATVTFSAITSAGPISYSGPIGYATPQGATV